MDPIYTTTVVYTIAAERGEISVSGLDESDGVDLVISNVSWDGKTLRFESFFPPTNHRAIHALSGTKKDRAKHTVTYSDEGGNHTVTESWKKKAS